MKMLTVTFASILMMTITWAQISEIFPESVTPAAADEMMGLLGRLAGNFGGEARSSGGIGSLFLPTLLQKLSRVEGLKATISESLGVKEDFIKPLVRIVNEMNKLNVEQPSDPKKAQQGLLKIYSGGDKDKQFEDPTTNLPKGKNVSKNASERNSVGPEPSVYGEANEPTINEQFLKLTKTIFEDELGGLDSILIPSSIDDPTAVSGNFTVTASSVWMMIKSTWQRILAYMEEENSLQYFMQLTPVKIIDRLLTLGDDVNLMNFLAKKLEPEFAMYLVNEIDPYLGPLRDFDSFYNFTKDYGVNGFLDYFRSDRFIRTMNTLSRLVSAYLEDKISGDMVNQYIELISFNNTELHNFYESVLRRQSQNSTRDETNKTQRFKRNVLDYIASSFKYSDFNPEDPQPDELQPKTFRMDDHGATDAEVYTSGDNKAGREMISRDGGYGGGGYGGGGYGGGGYGGYSGGYGAGYMSTLDPYVVLGALALGTLLGFLLFRLIRGTGNGRRDIGDGSLSLWLSDVPDKVLPWGTSVDRMKRDAHNFNTTGGDEFNLPDSLRGDVWSTDPLVGDNLLEDEYEEDDIADHLNQLWRVFQETSSPACLHSHLCGVVANSSAEHLTGKDSSLALLLASVGNLMGAVRPGQLVDHVTNTLVVGNPYTCPSLTSCHYHHLL